MKNNSVPENKIQSFNTTLEKFGKRMQEKYPEMQKQIQDFLEHYHSEISLHLEENFGPFEKYRVLRALYKNPAEYFSNFDALKKTIDTHDNILARHKRKKNFRNTDHLALALSHYNSAESIAKILQTPEGNKGEIIDKLIRFYHSQKYGWTSEAISMLSTMNDEFITHFLMTGTPLNLAVDAFEGNRATTYTQAVIRTKALVTYLQHFKSGIYKLSIFNDPRLNERYNVDFFGYDRKLVARYADRYSRLAKINALRRELHDVKVGMTKCKVDKQNTYLEKIKHLEEKITVERDIIVVCEELSACNDMEVLLSLFEEESHIGKSASYIKNLREFAYNFPNKEWDLEKLKTIAKFIESDFVKKVTGDKFQNSLLASNWDFKVVYEVALAYCDFLDKYKTFATQNEATSRT